MITLNKITFDELSASKVVDENTNVFSNYAWLSSLTDICLIGIYKGKGEIIGYFAHHVFLKGQFKIALTPPLTPFIPIFYKLESLNASNKLSEEKLILTAISDYFNSKEFSAVSINLPERIKDVHPFVWNKFNVSPRHSYEINLSRTEEDIYNQFAPERRKCIRKAEKENLTVKIIDDLKQDNYYHLFFKSRGLSIKQSHFEKLFYATQLKDHTLVISAFYNEIPVACKWFAHDQNRIYYLSGWYSDEHKNKCPDHYLMWEAIKWAKKNKISFFDFEGSMQPDIEKYFRDFGGSMITYHNVKRESKLFKIALSVSGKKFG